MVIFFAFSCSNHWEIFLKKLPLLFVLVLYPLKWLLKNMQCPQKYFSKMPVQKCDFWTLGERIKILVSKSQKSVEYRVKIFFLKNGYIFWIFLLYPLRKGVQTANFIPIQLRENLKSGLQNRFLVLYPLRR